MSLLAHPQIDWLLTAISAVIVGKIYGNMQTVLFVFVVLVIISIPFHYYFDVQTHTNYYLGLSDKPE